MSSMHTRNSDAAKAHRQASGQKLPSVLNDSNTLEDSRKRKHAQSKGKQKADKGKGKAEPNSLGLPLPAAAAAMNAGPAEESVDTSIKENGMRDTDTWPREPLASSANQSAWQIVLRDSQGTMVLYKPESSELAIQRSISSRLPFDWNLGSEEHAENFHETAEHADHKRRKTRSDASPLDGPLRDPGDGALLAGSSGIPNNRIATQSRERFEFGSELVPLICPTCGNHITIRSRENREVERDTIGESLAQRNSSLGMLESTMSVDDDSRILAAFTDHPQNSRSLILHQMPNRSSVDYVKPGYFRLLEELYSNKVQAVESNNANIRMSPNRKALEAIAGPEPLFDSITSLIPPSISASMGIGRASPMLVDENLEKNTMETAETAKTASDELKGEADVKELGEPRLARQSTLRRTSLNTGYYASFFSEIRRLGRGGFGSVFLCQHVLDAVPLSHYAIKIIPVGDSHEYLVKKLGEVQALESLKHPNIIDYKHSWLEYYTPTLFGPSDVPCLFILMEYADLGNISDMVDTTVLDEGKLLDYFKQIASGLQHLHHAGVIHHDLKPENILMKIAKDSISGLSQERLLLSDFGTSAILANSQAAKHSRTGFSGTMEWVAPEVLRQKGGFETTFEDDQKADIWSLGAILYYMSFQSSPFPGRAHEETGEDLDMNAEGFLARISTMDQVTFPEFPPRSDELRDLIKWMMNPQADQRPFIDEIFEHPFFLKFHTPAQNIGGNPGTASRSNSAGANGRNCSPLLGDTSPQGTGQYQANDPSPRRVRQVSLPEAPRVLRHGRSNSTALVSHIISRERRQIPVGSVSASVAASRWLYKRLSQVHREGNGKADEASPASAAPSIALSMSWISCWSMRVLISHMDTAAYNTGLGRVTSSLLAILSLSLWFLLPSSRWLSLEDKKLMLNSEGGGVATSDAPNPAVDGAAFRELDHIAPGTVRIPTLRCSSELLGNRADDIVANTHDAAAHSATRLTDGQVLPVSFLNHVIKNDAFLRSTLRWGPSVTQALVCLVAAVFELRRDVFSSVWQLVGSLAIFISQLIILHRASK